MNSEVIRPQNVHKSDLSIHRVFESDYIPRCWKCLGYFHKSSDCTELNAKCTKCSGNHMRKDCNSNDEECCNCLRENVNYHTKHISEHSPMSKVCSVFRSKLAIYQRPKVL